MPLNVRPTGVLARLRGLAPERFQDTQLRTVQRAVKAWRACSAREIILGGVVALTSTVPVDLMDEPSASHYWLDRTAAARSIGIGSDEQTTQREGHQILSRFRQGAKP